MWFDSPRCMPSVWCIRYKYFEATCKCLIKFLLHLNAMCLIKGLSNKSFLKHLNIEYLMKCMLLDCKSLDNKKLCDHLIMSCKPHLLMRCCHDPLMSCWWDIEVVQSMYYKFISWDRYNVQENGIKPFLLFLILSYLACALILNMVSKLLES
jgi:hypothetical protein